MENSVESNIKKTFLSRSYNETLDQGWRTFVIGRLKNDSFSELTSSWVIA